MWQALADPDGTYLWAAPSDDGAKNFADTDGAARYVPAVQLLKYSLGWSDPGAGLRWWYDHGQPLDDPRFALLDAMLGGDMDLLAAWYWTRWPYLEQGAPVDRAWLAAVQSRPGAGQWTDGSDQLHLEIHAIAPEQEQGTGAELFVGDRGERAVLVIDEYAGWYSKLRRYCAELPANPTSGPWWVDVFCRPVGSLGIYRRSRTTERWYAGPYSHHRPGCPGLEVEPDKDDDDMELYFGRLDDEE